MKLTDCLANILKKNNVKHVFGLQGGAVVHIFDSIVDTINCFLCNGLIIIWI